MGYTCHSVLVSQTRPADIIVHMAAFDLQCSDIKVRLTVVPTRTLKHAMNIIVVVLLAIVMASVDQSYFGAPVD